MDTLVENLNIFLKTALESNSDSNFYQSIYYYFDYIEKTPTLRNILTESQKEYANKHTKLWEGRPFSEKKASEAEAQTLKLERFNLYAISAGLYVRIYLPISDYRNTIEPDTEQDPVAILMLRGIKYAISLNKWKKETLYLYNRWFDNKRKNYEEELRNFHVEFISKIKDTKDNILFNEEIKKEENPLFLNINTGDFRFYKTSGNFSPNGQEFKVLKTLYESTNYQSKYLTLIQSYNPNIESDSKVYRDGLSLVIRNIKRNLKILPKNKKSNFDIFKNIKKFGYRLIFKP